MFKLLDLLDPTSWLFRGVAAVAIVAGVWFGIINPYNNYVSEKKVAAALKDERAKTEPAFIELTKNFKALETTFKQITEASNAERARRVAVIDQKTKELKNALGREKILNQNLAALRSTNSEFERLLNTATANNDSTTDASASARLRRLSSVHQQCQRALREANDDTTDALRILGEALATIDALKQ